ncbi:hypothetical protein WSM22_10270 [Cytophagales bacterium WSM2-2]|nr:hypothetical protein WSM22_10270 [Cytophagales bacterium WSM2-2]
MKKIFSKKLPVLFSTIAIGTCGVIFACGYVDFDDFFHSNFAPEAFVDASYTPLFHDPNHGFYSTEADSDPLTRFSNDITEDWSGYLQGKLSKDKVRFLLLEEDGAKAGQDIYTRMKNKQPIPQTYAYVNVADMRIRGFIEFMYYAKEIEKASTAGPSWNYDNTKQVLVDAGTIAEVERLYTATTDPFLKNRYWFQAMKANFYSANKKNAIAFFERTKATAPKNVLYYRAMAYVAGAYYSAKNFTQSNYMYSVAFDQCPGLRQVTAYSFHPQDGFFESSLGLAKTNEEKAALWSLMGFYGEERKAIREIYNLIPTSPHLDYLLTRLINKEETSLNELSFTTAGEYRQSVKNNLNKESLQLVSTIANENRTGKPFLWNTAAGYLNIFAGNYSGADLYLSSAEKQKLTDPSIQTPQLKLLKLINSIARINALDQASEEKILSDLTWLLGSPAEHEKFRYQNALSWSKRYIAALYKSQGNSVMAELFNSDEEFYRNETGLEAMKTFLTKSVKSEMEKLGEKNYKITLDDIYEYQAVMRAYNEKLDEAINIMEQSAKKDTELLGNPFNGKIKDCHDCDHATSLKVPYTKITFLSKMKEMQSNVQKGIDVYNNSMLLANAFYNMTYFGNARVFYYGSIMNQYGNYIEPYYQPQLLSSSCTRKYYQMALDAATTSEQKAKCNYMLAKCERNGYYTEAYHSKQGFYGETPVAYKEWAGFKRLKEEYSTTRYYQEVIKECGYFKSYLGL